MVKLEQDRDFVNGLVKYRVTMTEECRNAIRKMGFRTCEFNSHGGISLDFVRGGWNESGSITVDLAPETLAHKLMCIAFVVALEESKEISDVLVNRI